MCITLLRQTSISKNSTPFINKYGICNEIIPWKGTFIEQTFAASKIDLDGWRKFNLYTAFFFGKQVFFILDVFGLDTKTLVSAWKIFKL